MDLKNALLYGCWDEVRSLVGSADLSDFYDGATALHLATQGHKGCPLDVIGLLCDGGVAIDAVDANGRTALGNSILCESWDVTRELLRRGADVSVGSYTGGSALLEAATGHRDMPTDLVVQLIQPATVNMATWDGTALHLFVRGGRWDVVKTLVDSGADVSLVAGVVDQKSALLEAVAAEAAPADVISLLASPASVNQRHGTAGTTALHAALVFNHFSHVEVLVQQGADVNMFDGEYHTALHSAICRDAPEPVVAKLISHHNINVRGGCGISPVLAAVQHRRWDLIQTLVSAGADLGVVNDKGNTVVHEAILQKCTITTSKYMTDVVQDLVTTKNINAQNKELKSALHLAVRLRYWSLVILLVGLGANTGVQDMNGRTPLHECLMQYNTPAEVVGSLVSSSNIKVQDVAGDTAVHTAVKKRRWEVMSTLLARGGRDALDMKGSGGATPLHLALSQPDVRIEHVAEVISCGNINLPLGGLNDTNMRTATPLDYAYDNMRKDQVKLLVQFGAEFSLGRDIFKSTLIVSSSPRQPSALKKMCITTIRNCMEFKSDANFASLGLPERVLDLVKLKDLAEEMCSNW